MVNEIKEGMLTMFHQIENINKETEITKKKKKPGNFWSIMQ
jgi:hypothetical protein